ncbi:hypothetical protein ACFVYD_35975 [Streptomyces sp. NPDC058301]|uniref:hypothetical protein n=1 Tax=Streptomyces sp. NPDC058301 TaxID=3346436 RepID=UPI0036E97011
MLFQRKEIGGTGSLLAGPRGTAAIPALDRAVDLHRALVDDHGEGIAQANLGLALLDLGRFEEAIAPCVGR